MIPLSEELRRVIIGRVQKAGASEIIDIAASLCDNEPMIVETPPPVSPKDAPRYTIGEDTVTDNHTGLTWTRYDITTKRVNWADAKKAAAAARVGGHEDWRLPTIQELLSLVDYSRTDPAIDPAFGCQAAWYWTSTPYASSPSGCAWLVYFDGGASYWLSQAYEGFVRAVRPGQIIGSLA